MKEKMRFVLNHRRIAGIIILAIAVFTSAGCYDSRFGSPAETVGEEAATESIARFRERFQGVPFVMESDLVVEGVVVSSDRAGNFYRTLCIQQEQAALEIMAGIDQLHNRFPVGCPVTVHLRGLVVAQSRGVLQVGSKPLPGSGYDTDYIGSMAALERILVRQSEQLRVPEPDRLTIPELGVGRCGTLVRIDNLRYRPEEEEAATAERATWSGMAVAAEEPEKAIRSEQSAATEGSEIPDNRWSGDRRFVDPSGNEIWSYVRTYADFADDEIPDGEVSLVGILQYDDSGEGRFMIKLRDEKDCLLD